MKEVIRPGIRDDLARVEDIVFRAYSPYVEIIGKKPAPMDDDYSAKILEKSLYVLLANNEIAGLIILYFVNDALLIENVAVDPVHHGKGFGSILMRFAEDLAIQENLSAVILYTNESMTKNLEIYANMGYVFTHTSEFNGLKRIHMRKALHGRTEHIL